MRCHRSRAERHTHPGIAQLLLIVLATLLVSQVDATARYRVLQEQAPLPSFVQRARTVVVNPFASSGSNASGLAGTPADPRRVNVTAPAPPPTDVRMTPEATNVTTPPPTAAPSTSTATQSTVTTIAPSIAPAPAPAPQIPANQLAARVAALRDALRNATSQRRANTLNTTTAPTPAAQAPLPAAQAPVVDAGGPAAPPAVAVDSTATVANGPTVGNAPGVGVVGVNQTAVNQLAVNQTTAVNQTATNATQSLSAPTSNVRSPNNTNDDDDQTLGLWLGVGFGLAALLAILLGVCVFVTKRQQRQARSNNSSSKKGGAIVGGLPTIPQSPDNTVHPHKPNPDSPTGKSHLGKLSFSDSGPLAGGPPMGGAGDDADVAARGGGRAVTEAAADDVMLANGLPYIPTAAAAAGVVGAAVAASTSKTQYTRKNMPNQPQQLMDRSLHTIPASPLPDRTTPRTHNSIEAPSTPDVVFAGFPTVAGTPPPVPTPLPKVVPAMSAATPPVVPQTRSTGSTGGSSSGNKKRMSGGSLPPPAPVRTLRNTILDSCDSDEYDVLVPGTPGGQPGVGASGSPGAMMDAWLQSPLDLGTPGEVWHTTSLPGHSSASMAPRPTLTKAPTVPSSSTRDSAGTSAGNKGSGSLGGSGGAESGSSSKHTTGGGLQVLDELDILDSSSGTSPQPAGKEWASVVAEASRLLHEAAAQQPQSPTTTLHPSTTLPSIPTQSIPAHMGGRASTGSLRGSGGSMSRVPTRFRPQPRRKLTLESAGAGRSQTSMSMDSNAGPQDGSLYTPDRLSWDVLQKGRDSRHNMSEAGMAAFKALRRTASHEALQQAAQGRTSTSSKRISTSMPGNVDPELDLCSSNEGAPGAGRGRGSAGISSSDGVSAAARSVNKHPLLDSDPVMVSADARSSGQHDPRASLVSTGTSQHWQQAWLEE